MKEVKVEKFIIYAVVNLFYKNLVVNLQKMNYNFDNLVTYSTKKPEEINLIICLIKKLEKTLIGRTKYQLKKGLIALWLGLKKI